jgi:hypothetical protein
LCSKCDEIDKQIARLQDLAASMLDQTTTDRISKMIREWRDEKAGLHPERK